MVAHKLSKMSVLVMAGTLLSSCSDRSNAPSALAENTPVKPTDHLVHQFSGDLASLSTDPFTYRAAIDPYRIHQLPDFMVHSAARTDIVMQRSIFNPGAGPWHTHPGPSFVYVVDGQIKLDRFTEKDGWVETPVFGPGAAYFEIANEVHRAVVVSATPAVLLVTRFNIPVGGALTIPAADPGCWSADAIRWKTKAATGRIREIRATGCGVCRGDRPQLVAAKEVATRVHFVAGGDSIRDTTFHFVVSASSGNFAHRRLW